MKVENLKEPSFQDLNRRDAETAMLRGTLAEAYYLLKDRSSRGIDKAISNIEEVFQAINIMIAKGRQM